MKGLFQCPPWARSFCPFRACSYKSAKSQSLRLAMQNINLRNLRNLREIIRTLASS